MRKFCKEISLAYLNPELSKEWNFEKNYPLTPEDVRCGSHKKVGWECEIGHKYDATVNDRGRRRGCPYCAGKRVCKDNCLATKNPILAKEWDYERNEKLTPKDVVCGSKKKVYWKCSLRHRWLATIVDRNRGSGCPYCSGNSVCIDNCLATVNPELSKQWHPTKNGKLTSYDVTYCSGKKIWWVSDCGHEWLSTIYNRVSGNSCPYCSGKRAYRDNCLATINPRLAKEWDYSKNGNITPKDIMPNSHVLAHWICNNGHEYLSTIANRTSNGSDCPYCNKIELKSGALCDSKPEAYYWLDLDNKNISFKYHVKIGLGKCVCDFYIPSTNTYIEVTGYNKKSHRWKTYHKNILKKKNHITKTLKANFKFVQIRLTPKQIQYVRENSI